MCQAMREILAEERSWGHTEGKKEGQFLSLVNSVRVLMNSMG